jgi:hypothetical protein
VSSIQRLLETEADSWREVLVTGEVAALMHRCGLDSISMLLRDLPPGIITFILHAVGLSSWVAFAQV